MMKIAEFENMWNELDNIFMNDNDEIEQDFYHWEKGTCRFDIWLWFDEKLPNGLVYDFCNLKYN